MITTLVIVGVVVLVGLFVYLKLLADGMSR